MVTVLGREFPHLCMFPQVLQVKVKDPSGVVLSVAKRSTLLIMV